MDFKIFAEQISGIFLSFLMGWQLRSILGDILDALKNHRDGGSDCDN